MRKALLLMALVALQLIQSPFLSGQEPHILKRRASLTFTFTPNFIPLAKGQWRLVVVTPDKKTFKGHLITMPISPVTPVSMKIHHPLYSGIYTVATENVSVTNISTPSANLIDGLVTVSNSLNLTTIDVPVADALTNDPGTIQVGTFTLFHLGD